MKESNERLFFALWPADSVRTQLLKNYHDISALQGKGRCLRPGNLHLTLHFLGNIESSRVACFVSQAKRVHASAFVLTLDRFGHFSKPRVAWIGCQQIPSALTDLQLKLGKFISECAFEPENRAYNPHVTMARKINQVPNDIVISPIVWQIDEFVLVKSVTHPAGVEYQVKETFALESVK